MNTTGNLNPATAYFGSMLNTAYGVNLINVTIPEWQIDAIKECTSKLKEREIEHSLLSYEEKDKMKRQWKAYIEAAAQGIKDELRRNNRLG